MNFKLKTVIKSLIFGCISAIILMFFELRYLFSSADFSLIKPGIVLLLVSQSIFFAIVFLVTPLTLKYIRMGYHKGNHLYNIGLALQIITILFVVIAAIYVPYLFYLNFIIGFTLLCIGVISNYKTKNELAITFILWGIAILISSFFFTSVGYLA